MKVKKRSLVNLTPITKSSFVFIGVIALFLLTGCNQTEDFEDLEMLTNQNWQLISKTQDGVDIIDDCDLDDILLFEDASNFDFDAGDLTCPNSLNLESRSWKIIDDFTVLRMKYKFTTENGIIKSTLIEYWKIIELTSTSLIVEDASAEDNDQVPEIRTYQN